MLSYAYVHYSQKVWNQYGFLKKMFFLQVTDFYLKYCSLNYKNMYLDFHTNFKQHNYFQH